MDHFDQTRPPIDTFELTLINAYSDLNIVEAIWVRDVPCPARETPAVTKTFLRCVWLQLARIPGSLRPLEVRAQELGVRTLKEPFDLEIHWVADDLPPLPVAPSCIYRRRAFSLKTR